MNQGAWCRSRDGVCVRDCYTVIDKTLQNKKTHRVSPVGKVTTTKGPWLSMVSRLATGVRMIRIDLLYHKVCTLNALRNLFRFCSVSKVSCHPCAVGVSPPLKRFG